MMKARLLAPDGLRSVHGVTVCAIRAPPVAPRAPASPLVGRLAVLLPRKGDRTAPRTRRATRLVGGRQSALLPS
jgi:hypothetical protein